MSDAHKISIVSMGPIERNHYSIKISVMDNNSILVCVMDNQNGGLSIVHFTKKEAAKEYIKSYAPLRNVWE